MVLAFHGNDFQLLAKLCQDIPFLHIHQRDTVSKRETDALRTQNVARTQKTNTYLLTLFFRLGSFKSLSAVRTNVACVRVGICGKSDSLAK